MRVPCLILASVLAITTQAAAAAGLVPLSDRVRGADRVVVAKVMDLHASYETNEHGDQLIVSRVKLQVEDSLKGSREGSLEIDVLGGTVGDLTLDVSDLPKMARGQRAVFFLTTHRHTGRLVPFLSGQGILELDAQDRVKGISLHLTSIKQLAASVAGR